MSIRLLALLSCLALLSACGGGGGSSAAAVLPMQLAPSLDGYIDKGGIRGLTPPVVTDGLGRAGGGGVCRLGTPPSCHESRQFLIFDRSVLPAGAVVTSATMRVYQERVDGTPYLSRGSLVADHVDVGGTLAEADFDAPALALGFGELSTTPALEYKSLDVTAQVAADAAAGRSTSAFRVRFTLGANSELARTWLTTVEDLNATGKPPALEITYTLP